MNQKQQNQIKQIKKSIDDLTENYPDLSVFVSIIQTDFDLDYRTIEKQLTESDKIDEFIQTYQEKINDLYGLI